MPHSMVVAMPFSIGAVQRGVGVQSFADVEISHEALPALRVQRRTLGASSFRSPNPWRRFFPARTT
jgi:hypothetical protein